MCLGKENARRGIGALETCPPLIKHFSFFLLSSWVTVAAFCSETRCLTAVMPKTLVLGYSYVALPPYGVPLKLSRVCVAWEQKERSLLLDPRFLSPLVPLLPFCTRIQPSPACACSHRCVQHSNPMFAGGSSEKLVFCGEARWRGSQAKDWQQHLNVTLLNLPTSVKYWLWWVTGSSACPLALAIFSFPSLGWWLILWKMPAVCSP